MYTGDNVIRIVNYEEMIQGCEVILETCFILNLPTSLAWTWVNSYLAKYIKIEV